MTRRDLEERVRGLPSVAQARVARTSRFPRTSPRFWLGSGAVLAVWAVFYWKQSSDEVEAAKAALFTRQRAIAAELSPKLDPLRDRFEAWTVQSSGAFGGELVDPDAARFLGTAVPGVYLRLRLADARSVDTIRQAATASLRDGFNACLARVPWADPTAGPACRGNGDCAAGLFCNELDHCTPPAQPWNLRVMYRGARVLSEPWTLALRTASDDVQVRLKTRELDGAVKDDIPAAIELLTRAKSFLLVLDEPPEGVAPDASADAIQAEPHVARVMLWGLEAPYDWPLLRVRRDARGQLVASAGSSRDPELLAAQQRQVNNCALAGEVLAAIPQPTRRAD